MGLGAGGSQKKVIAGKGRVVVQLDAMDVKTFRCSHFSLGWIPPLHQQTPCHHHKSCSSGLTQTFTLQVNVLSLS